MLSAASDGDDAVFATAATQIEAATEAGHPGAQSALAFLTGTGMTRMASRSLAFLLHKFAADAGDLQSKMALAYSYFRLEVRWPRPFASQHRQRLHRDAQRQHPQPDAGGRWEKSASHLARDRQIHTLCIGAAAGHACLMLAAGKKGKRYMFPHAKAMIQQPRIPSYGMMQASDFVIRAKELVYRSSYDRCSWCHFQQALG